MQLLHLNTINLPTKIGSLTSEQLKELQSALNRLGYPSGDVDGWIGPKTRNAWSEFKDDIFESGEQIIGHESFDSVKMLQQSLDQLENGKSHEFITKKGTIEAIKWECQSHGIGLKTQIAYVLATVEWETNQTFKPVREAYWINEAWRKTNLSYYPFYGRGYVQLTWENNYKKYSDILGVDLVKTPDIAMDNNIALFILVHGFKTGIFTGRKITDYINANQTDFIKARRCINGNDHARDIANLAEEYLAL